MIIRNVLINFSGQIAPVVAAAVSMPLLAGGLGLERLGLLNLAWVVLGSFGLLDLGLGRALTQLAAARLDEGNTDALQGLFTAACGLLFAVGLLFATVLALSAHWIVAGGIHISAPLQPESLRSLYLLAAGVPFMMTSSAARGFLEAHQRFGLVNAVRAPLGVFTYGGPLLVLPFTQSVAAAVLVIAVARIVACAVYLALGWALLPRPRTRLLPNRADTRQLVSTGAWMTSANVAGSVIAYADRFVLSATASVVALAYYATPQELIGRLTIIPMTLIAVVFPVFSGASAERRDEMAAVFEKSGLYTYLMLFPITFLGSAFAPTWLGVWMGPDFSARSVAVTQWFCLGVFLNSLAVMPTGLLQAAGRADLTAKFQFYELPIYVAALAYTTVRFGMTGAAVTWAARAGVDALLLYNASIRLMPSGRTLRPYAQVVAVAVLAFVLVSFSSAFSWRIAVFLIVAGWFGVMVPRLIDRNDLRAVRVALWGSESS